MDPSTVAAPEPAPPRLVWMMGLANMVYGFGYAVVLVTVPQMLAARGVPEPEIANLTALALSVALATFVLAPLLDTSINRRQWSVGLAVLSALLVFLVLTIPATSAAFAPLVAGAALSLSLYNSAIGGWLGATLPQGSKETIGVWFGVGNSGGFGIGAISQFWLLTHAPPLLGAVIVAAVTLVPLAFLLALPPPDAGRKAMRESFGNLGRDVTKLVRQAPVLRILLMFVLPCAAFTLTNFFGGVGKDFHASPGVVDIANGVGATVVGFVTAMLIKPVLKFLPAPLMYLAVGSIGAAFTLSLLAMPFTPVVYVIAVCGENAAQTIAQVAQNAIMFRSIAPGSPLASTQFGLLSTSAVVPYAYMQALDGRGYAWHGVSGAFAVDAALSLGACVLLVVPVLHWMRSGALTVALVETEITLPSE